MIGRILGLDKLGRVTDLSLYFRHPWPLLVAVGLIGVAAVATGVLYRRERGLSRGQRVLLGVFRVVLYGILILLLFEPVLTVERSVELRKSVLVLVDSSESMGIHDERKSRAELEEAALALGLQPFDRTSFALSAEAKNTIRKATRLDLAKALLDHPELDAFDRLAREHRLRLFRFGSGLEPLGQERDAALGSTADLEATDKATHVGAAISEAVGRYGGGESVAAVIVLTDGASNGGLEPLEVARRLKKQGIPLFPIGLGLPRQPDVRIQTIVAQENVFAGDRLPVRVELESLGLPGRTVDLVATLSGREVARRAEFSARVETLSVREREAMDLLVTGKHAKQIAAKFKIGEKTVAKHRARILEKMQVESVAELVHLVLTSACWTDNLATCSCWVPFSSIRPL